ncbi:MULTISPECIES: hypothetical protein [unclassified Sphingopyxis]|uniref:hypothetical protein n=1 Tax=unclassified Sphingopyxis TaxID=2614943 RepID=UPI0006F4C368|nr:MULTISPECIES: hypothetical protein [unclassified Sphingopyxis]
MSDTDMELAEFIRQALSDIAFGVHEARVDCQEVVAIAPGILNGQPVQLTTDVSFDIAVTTAKSSTDSRAAKSGAEGFIKVVGFGAKIGGQSEDGGSNGRSDETISRISFKIPIQLNAHFRNDPGAETERERIKALVAARKKG